MIELIIRYDPRTGALQVVGPIDNAPLAYGLLELARDCIHERARTPQSRLVLPPDPTIKQQD